ncbi:unnamed protein product [Ectocarpus sp. 12 AP-2014]
MMTCVRSSTQLRKKRERYGTVMVDTCPGRSTPSPISTKTHHMIFDPHNNNHTPQKHRRWHLTIERAQQQPHAAAAQAVATHNSTRTRTTARYCSTGGGTSVCLRTRTA